MAIIVNGIDLETCDAVMVNGTPAGSVVVNGTVVWTRSCCQPGSATFNVPGNYSWIAPTDVYSVELCAIGGGGAGGNVEDNPGANPLSAGGGYAGTEYHKTDQAVSPGYTYGVTVGAGGIGRDQGGVGGHTGQPGEASKFGGITIGGGAGGKGMFSTSYQPYDGNGATVPSGCGGSGHRDGYRADSGYRGSGGQGSSFGNGGDGEWCNINGCAAHNGGVGAGGGGLVTINEFVVAEAGDGGRGEVRVSWDCGSKEKGETFDIYRMTDKELSAIGIFMDIDKDWEYTVELYRKGIINEIPAQPITKE